MARNITETIVSQRTYKTKENLIKAIDALGFDDNIRYVVTQDENGRYFPYFIGTEALQQQLFRFFPVIA
jgi:hypothetical protein